VTPCDQNRGTKPCPGIVIGSSCGDRRRLEATEARQHLHGTSHRQKNDPQYIAAARELRDRYLEQVNTGQLLPPAANGKYDVSRQLDAAPTQLKTTNLLDAA